MGTMSKAEFFSKIRSLLRRGFMFYLPMQKALEMASRPSENKFNLRLKKEFLCAHCSQYFARKDVAIDHIQEVGELNDWDQIVDFIKNLTCEDPACYQILCKSIKDKAGNIIHEGCHDKKTQEYRRSKKLENDKLKENES